MKKTLALLGLFLAVTLGTVELFKRLLDSTIDSKYFSSGTPISIVTPTYSDKLDTDDNSTIVIDESAPILDASFPYYNFSLDDTNYLYADSLGLTCQPSSFGYSYEEGKKVFPDYFYPPCSDNNLGLKATITIRDNTLEVTCPNNTQAYYLLQPLEAKFKLYSKSKMYPLWDIKEYTGPVKLTDEEFVFAKCGDENFKAFHYAPKFNQAAYDKAKANQAALGPVERPQVVLLLTIDSYSRRHFFRKMPETVQYLQSLNGSDFEVYDFKLHNIVGGNSVQNMVPILGNYSEMHYLNNYDGDFLASGGLWNIFKNAGYMTMIGFEACDRYFVETLGQAPQADHLTRSFYCGTRQFLSLKSSKSNTLKQRCIGDYMSHYYLLNYTYSFSKLYPDMNQWMYIHSTAAHEATGLHAITLDKDMVHFLKLYVEEISVTHDVTILMHADHGMRYGKWTTSTKGTQENKMPTLFVIASKNILAKYSEPKLRLHHNSLALTSKKDLRATMLSLMYLPYNNTHYDRRLDPYSMDFIDLFQDFSSPNRTCELAGIPLVYCSCTVLEEIDSDRFDSDEYPELATLLRNLAEETVFYMNSVVQSEGTSRMTVCQTMSFDKIDKAWGVHFSNVVEEIKLQFRVKESDVAKFEVIFTVGIDVEDLNGPAVGNPISFSYNNVEATARVSTYVDHWHFASRHLRRRL